MAEFPLISSQASSAAGSAGSPVRFIAEAARATGVDFDFLMRTAARESNFDPDARARTSSASGMFQFIEQTWLAMMSRHGEKHGVADLSKAIDQRSDGRFQVTDPAKRDAILDLRFDAGLSSRLAGELANENAASLRTALGREPTRGELYAAHFLGASGAAELIQAAQSQPGLRADTLFPAAAEANRPIFYEQGRARSVQEVLDRLVQLEEGAPPRPLEGNVTAPAAPTHAAPFQTPVRGPVTGGVLSPALVEILASLDVPGGRKDER
ncbi:MAG: transglycosylase SLT domain-containing protein [Pseudomonadota bacterium]